MNKNTKLIVGVLVAAVVILVAYIVLNKPDDRSLDQRLGDAVSELGDGVENAADEIQGKTTLDKIEDSVNEAIDDIRQ